MKFRMLILTLIHFTFFAQEHSSEENHTELKISTVMINELGITFTKVNKTFINQKIKAYGEVIATNNGESEVGTLLTGRVIKTYIKLGQYVNKGDKLFEISSLEVLELIDKYYIAKAELNRATKNYNRIAKLKKDGIGSERSYLEVELEYEKSKTNFESTDRKIHALGFTDDELNEIIKNNNHNSANMFIKAPISGEITQLHVKNGQFISGEETMAVIVNRDQLWARLHIYENNISLIKKNLNVLITSPINPDLLSDGKIISHTLSFMMGKKSSEVITTIESPNKFVIGSYITALISQKNDKKVWALPSESVINEDNEYYVFIKKTENEFEKKKVIIGKTNEHYFQILNGINENDIIVQKGTFYLKSLAKGEDIGGHHD